MRLSVIGTVHQECGRANVEVLRGFLRRLAPDVVFAEVPQSKLPAYANGSHGTLESMAVDQARNELQLAIVPVDLDEPETSFFRNAEEMFKKIERVSQEYRSLIDRHRRNVRDSGFAYLNSDLCFRAWSDIHGEVLDTLDWIQDARSKTTYGDWVARNELREVAMVEGILACAESGTRRQGVLLVGAAHRKAILDKLASVRPLPLVVDPAPNEMDFDGT